MPIDKRLLLACFVYVFSLAGLVGCGGSGSTPATPPVPTVISSTQIASASTQLAKTFVAAVKTTSASACSNAFQNNYFCDAPLLGTAACSGAGTAVLTGSMSDSWAYYATGTGSGPLNLTITGCAIPNSTLTMTGDPNLTGTGIMSFFYSSPTSVTATEVGSFTYGTTPTGVCQVNLAVTATFPSNGSATCTYSGTVCGQAVSASCL